MSSTAPWGEAPPLAERLQVPLLGAPVLYRSNSAAVIAAASRALGRWSGLPADLIERGPPAAVDIVVHPGELGEAAATDADRFVFRAHGDAFLAAAGGNLMSAQLAQGTALAFVTPELAADEQGLRRHVIERLGLLLASRHDRAPVGAAAVVRHGRAVLLLDASGAGSSALCHACVRAGFALLADDTAYVSLARGLRVWGHAGPLHLPRDARHGSAERVGLGPRARADGGLSLAADPRDVSPAAVATHAERAIVCLTERGPGQASRLEPVPPAEAAAWIEGTPERGRGPQPDRAAVAAALTAGGAYRLTLGSDPASAAALLAHLTEA